MKFKSIVNTFFLPSLLFLTSSCMGLVESIYEVRESLTPTTLNENSQSINSGDSIDEIVEPSITPTLTPTELPYKVVTLTPTSTQYEAEPIFCNSDDFAWSYSDVRPQKLSVEGNKIKYDALVEKYRTNLGIDFTQIRSWEHILESSKRENYQPWQTDKEILFESSISKEDREHTLCLLLEVLPREVIDENIKYVENEDEWGGTRDSYGISINYANADGSPFWYREVTWHEMGHGFRRYSLGNIDLTTILELENLIYDSSAHINTEYTQDDRIGLLHIMDTFYTDLDHKSTTSAQNNPVFDLGVRLQNKIYSMGSDELSKQLQDKHEQLLVESLSDNDKFIELGFYFIEQYNIILNEQSIDSISKEHIDDYTTTFSTVINETHTDLLGNMFLSKSNNVDPAIVPLVTQPILDDDYIVGNLFRYHEVFSGVTLDPNNIVIEPNSKYPLQQTSTPTATFTLAPTIPVLPTSTPTLAPVPQPVNTVAPTLEKTSVPQGLVLYHGCFGDTEFTQLGYSNIIRADQVLVPADRNIMLTKRDGPYGKFFADQTLRKTDEVMLINGQQYNSIHLSERELGEYLFFENNPGNYIPIDPNQDAVRGNISHLDIRLDGYCQ